MPEVRTDVTLENTIDRGVVRRGHGSEADIRRTTVSGLVNTGAAPVMLPPDVVEDLGLDLVGTARITYGDERPDEVGVAGPVTIAIGDRNVMTECLVGRPGSQVLIGHVVLAHLDLLADCRNGTVTPRHPDGLVIAVR